MIVLKMFMTFEEVQNHSFEPSEFLTSQNRHYQGTNSLDPTKVVFPQDIGFVHAFGSMLLSSM